MQLLVSVADASEGRAALLGGADVIDAKDPREGALGAVRPEVLGELRAAVGAGRLLSAALGDAGPPVLVECRARAAARLGATFVKVGFRGAATVSQARRRAAAARRGAGERTRVVLVAYADWPRADSLGPGPLLELAVEIGAAGVLRSEEHTSELQSPCNLVCRLLLEKKNTMTYQKHAVLGIMTNPPL